MITLRTLSLLGALALLSLSSTGAHLHKGPVADAGHHHHHHPHVLAGSLFREATPSRASGPKTLAPCPTECVEHAPGIFLAVTSIGEGFPRIQYTCTGPHHSKPTPASDKDHRRIVEDHRFSPHHNHHQQSIHANDNVLGSKSPADPSPEHTAVAHDSTEQQTDGVLAYPTLFSEDLLITSNDPSVARSRSQQDSLGAFKYRSFHGYSPREQGSEEPSQTTTMTYSPDEHPPTRLLRKTDRISMESKAQKVSAPGVSVPAESTVPEPIVTLQKPTLVGHQGVRLTHGRHHDHREHHDHHDRSSPGTEQKVGPAPPSPEPTPIQGRSLDHGHGIDIHAKNQPDLHVRHQSYANNHQLLQHHHDRTVVHRTTTYIIETETIIARSDHPTSAIAAIHPPTTKTFVKYEDQDKDQDQNKDFQIGDHVLFDAGVEGDMVVSLAASGHARPGQDKTQARAR